MSFFVLYSSNIVCITPRFDAILSEKSGIGFSCFYFRDIKASGEERVSNLLMVIQVYCDTMHSYQLFGIIQSGVHYIVLFKDVKLSCANKLCIHSGAVVSLIPKAVVS